jgi:hypothetical protein
VLMVREEEVGGSKKHEMATLQPHNSTVSTSDQLTQAEKGPSKVEAQTRVYFPTIVEGSMS